MESAGGLDCTAVDSSGVAAKAYASDLVGRFVMSGNMKAPSRRGVDADAL